MHFYLVCHQSKYALLIITELVFLAELCRMRDRMRSMYSTTEGGKFICTHFKSDFKAWAYDFVKLLLLMKKTMVNIFNLSAILRKLKTPKSLRMDF